MDFQNLYRDIAERTRGDIYIGVVGPVRTGKSTFIKRFMDLLVIPNIDNTYSKERAKDELPQSAAGRTIMTTEPKFVPNEAVEIALDPHASDVEPVFEMLSVLPFGFGERAVIAHVAVGCDPDGEVAEEFGIVWG